MAYPVTTTEPTAFENHISFIHQGTSHKVVPLSSETLARGLSLWLNSTHIDDWFRGVSGSTQVNAKNIRAMPCPDEEALTALGERWRAGMSQRQIDEAVRGLL